MAAKKKKATKAADLAPALELVPDQREEKKRTKAPPLVDAPPPPHPSTIPPPAGKLAKQEYRLFPIEAVKLHPKNPKKGNVDAIGKSIEKNDFYGAIIVQKSTGFMLAGNHRWKAAVEKGLREVPVIELDCDDSTAERILLADNRTSDLGSYDEAALFALMTARAADGGLEGTGFVDMDFEKMKAKLAAPEKFPEFDEGVTVTKRCPSCGFSWS